MARSTRFAASESSAKGPKRFTAKHWLEFNARAHRCSRHTMYCHHSCRNRLLVRDSGRSTHRRPGSTASARPCSSAHTMTWRLKACANGRSGVRFDWTLHTGARRSSASHRPSWGRSSRKSSGSASKRNDVMRGCALPVDENVRIASSRSCSSQLNAYGAYNAFGASTQRRIASARSKGCASWSDLG